MRTNKIMTVAAGLMLAVMFLYLHGAAVAASDTYSKQLALNKFPLSVATNAATTNGTYSIPIRTYGSTTITAQYTHKGVGTNATAANKVYWKTSVDGIYWNDTPYVSNVLTLTADTPVTESFNMTIPANIQFMKLSSVEINFLTTNSFIITNLVLGIWR